MVINLSKSKGDDDVRATILHEFGHALGLGHENQHPFYTQTMKKFLDQYNTWKYSCLKSVPEFLDQYGDVSAPYYKSDYDQMSVVHYL